MHSFQNENIFYYIEILKRLGQLRELISKLDCCKTHNKTFRQGKVLEFIRKLFESSNSLVPLQPSPV